MREFYDFLDLTDTERFYACEIKHDVDAGYFVYRAVYRTLNRNGNDIERYVEVRNSAYGARGSWQQRSGYRSSDTAVWWTCKGLHAETAPTFAEFVAKRVAAEAQRKLDAANSAVFRLGNSIA